MPKVTLEDKIRMYVSLPAQPSSKGWYSVLHTACDHGRKGPRAAFKFDGDNVGFHCFNCPLKAKYTPSEHPYLSDNMKQVMDDFGIPESEYQEVVLANLKNHPSKSEGDLRIFKENLEPEVIPQPKTFYPLSGADNAWAELARYYLEEERAIKSDAYPFMLSEKTALPHLKKWHGRLIIPIFKNGKLIFYLGRDLTGKKMRKYESPAVSRDKIIQGYDLLHQSYEQPLYIVEGWFDAFVIDGVGIIGNEISETKAKILNRSPRKKIYVPDRFGSGKKAAIQALEYGWSVSTPNISSDCKDMNDAVRKYGKLYVLKTLADNTSDGFEAEVNLGIYCNK